MKKYPVFLDLAGKTCLVVGAGIVAERKVEVLLETGARVKVVAPQGTDTLTGLARAKRLTWEKRDFDPADIKGAALVVAATADESVNEQVHQEAVKHEVLINVVDRPDLCTFFVPAVMSRGRLQIAISTDGASPALARRLREQLEDNFGPEYGNYLEIIGDFRRRVRQSTTDQNRRKEAYDRLLDSDLLDQVRRGKNIDVDNLVAEYVQ